MVKETPDYQWVCQRCKADNAPHTRTCAECGFSASFTAAQLAEVQGVMRPVGVALADVGVVAAVLAWYALFHDSPLIMLVGLKMFLFGGLIVAALLFVALKSAFDFIVALFNR